MADLPTLLLASLNPQTRKQAEQNIDALSTQPGFLSHILQLALTQSQDRSVRLSAAVYLKNLTKLRWDEVGLRITNNTPYLILVVGVGCPAFAPAGQRPTSIRARSSHASPLNTSRQDYSCPNCRVYFIDRTTGLSREMANSDRCIWFYSG